jgi:hypothetical protein
VKRNSVAHYVLMYLKFNREPCTLLELRTFSSALNRADYAVRSLEKHHLVSVQGDLIHLLPAGRDMLTKITARTPAKNLRDD